MIVSDPPPERECSHASEWIKRSVMMSRTGDRIPLCVTLVCSLCGLERRYDRAGGS